MMKRKKADMSIQVIVIAAISLVVLIVLVLIFTGNLGNVNKSLSSCTDKGGTCKPASGDCPDDRTPVPGYKDEGGKACICCMKLG